MASEKRPVGFALITKVDEATRTVTGRMTQEVPDFDGEVMDYESSKPNFERWSREFQRATGGKSRGNVRAMHGAVAAGKLVEFAPNDVERAFDCRAKITDDNEWAKVLDGTYTGFSIGGRYGRTWEDPDEPELTRFEAIPTEVSLVDAPCVPTALFFEVRKADGTTMRKRFSAAGETDMGEGAGGIGLGGFGASPLDRADGGLGKTAEREDVSEADRSRAKEEYDGPPSAEKGMNVDTDGRATGSDVDGNTGDAEIDGDTTGTGDAEKGAKIDADEGREEIDRLERENAEAEMADAGADNESEDADVPDEDEFDFEMAVDARRPGDLKKLCDEAARQGLTASDLLDKIAPHGTKARWLDPAGQRFPVDTAAQAKAAWRFVNGEAAKAHYGDGHAKLVDACREAYLELVGEEPGVAGKAASGELRKDLWACRQLLDVVQSLNSLARSAEWESFQEGDASELPDQLRAALVASTSALKTCVEEELSESDLGEGGYDRPMAMAAVSELADALATPVTKRGARNSRADAGYLQAAHDALVKAGAMCGKAMGDGDLGEGAGGGFSDAAVGDLQKRNADLEKRLAEAEARVKELEARPRPMKARLVVVEKGQDYDPGGTVEGADVTPVTLGGQEQNEVATLIKAQHRTGGQRVTLDHVRK